MAQERWEQRRQFYLDGYAYFAEGTRVLDVDDKPPIYWWPEELDLEKWPYTEPERVYVHWTPVLGYA